MFAFVNLTTAVCWWLVWDLGYKLRSYHKYFTVFIMKNTWNEIIKDTLQQLGFRQASTFKSIIIQTISFNLLRRYIRFISTAINFIPSFFNYWVTHPVALVSIKYWKNLRTQQSIFWCYISLCTSHTICFGPVWRTSLGGSQTQKYLRHLIYIQRIRWVGMHKVNIVVR
jgi:hypothetical protein